MLRWKTIALLLLAALTFPAAAQPPPWAEESLEEPPPWAVESPAAAGAGARFGLGLDAFFENQKSLRIASQQSVTLLKQPDGSSLPMVVNGDPELLNRKFDLEWELRGAGVRVPLALSCFKLTDLVRVFPTLTFEAAEADISLDILDKPEPNFSTSLQGRGPLFGTEIGMMANLGVRGFTGITYHFRNLPSLQVDRSSGFAEPGFEVLHDEVRLSQEIHEVITKAGYVSLDGKTAYYTGLRARQTDVEIEDDLRLRDGIFGRETNLKSRSKLDSEVVEAIVGVDRHLGGSMYARTEASFGDQDYGVMLRVAYVGPPATEPTPKFESPVVLPTLKLFWDLASLQLRDPAVSKRLLSTDPREPERTLDSLGIGFKKYRKRLARTAGLRPVILFVSHGTDLLDEARRQALAISSWPVQAPPAVLSGPELDTLVLFEPMRVGANLPIPSIRAQVASAAKAAFAFAEGPSDDPVDPRFYRVDPDRWSSSVKFLHTRCRYLGAESRSQTSLVTLLTYAGGATDRSRKPLSKGDWVKCPVDPNRPAVIAEQSSRPRTKGRVIIAASYFTDPGPSPLIADWIGVER